MPLESCMDGIAKSVDDYDHGVDIEEMEAQGVLVSGLVHEAAVHAVKDMAMSVPIWVETNWERPHMLAMVCELTSL